MATDHTTDFNDAEAVIDLCERAADVVRETTGDTACSDIPARGSLLATGDLHDNPFHYRHIVELARLDASPDHHVVLHELIHGERLLNGMDFSYRMLGRVAELVTRFPGQVHPVLANHELAQMTRRAVSKGAGNSVELFDDALEYTFGDDSEAVAEALNEFIRAMPLALRSENGVLCAHSVPNEARMKSFDVGVLDRTLTDDDYAGPTGSAYLMTWGRGYTEAQIEGLAETWGVRLFCLGHMHVEMGIDVFGPRTVILNSDHEHGRVVRIPLDDVPSAEMVLMSALPVMA